MKKRLLLLFAIIGPGIITANIDNDAGGITTYSVAGARFGYSLLWTLIPTTITLIVVQEMVARMGVVTGRGLSDIIRERYGVKVTVYMMIALLIANYSTTVAEFAGWAASFELLGISRYISVPIAVFAVWILVTKGTYRSVERILLAACVIYIGFIISAFMARPEWGEVLRNTFTPRFKLDSEYVMMTIGIVGTTITPWMQFYLQSSISEKGIRKEDYRYSKLDVVIGCSITDIIAFFIIVTSAATLFPLGIRIENASEAAMALEPMAGKYASTIFAVSLANASLLGAIIVPLATAYYICEGIGWEAGINKTFEEAPQFMWLYTGLIALSALVVLFPKAPLITIMVIAQVINGIILPFVLIYVLLLVNNKELMNNYVNPRSYNIIAWITIGVMILLSVILFVTIFIPNL
ncbi:MAG: Nramp family divalent metal transporter [Nitrospirota bacterium]